MRRPRKSFNLSSHEAGHSSLYQFARWQAITAFDVITELLLFGISLYMLRGLTLKMSKKFIVLSAFALRLPSVSQSLDHNLAVESLKTSPESSYQRSFAFIGWVFSTAAPTRLWTVYWPQYSHRYNFPSPSLRPPRLS